jgi:hypothetical protein
MAADAHQAGDVPADAIRRDSILHGDLNHADVVAAGDAALKGTKRDDNHIVLVLPHGVLAFGFEQPDDFAGKLLQANPAANGILPAEQLRADGLADDTDGGTQPGLAGGEGAAVFHPAIAEREVLLGGAGDGGGPVFVGVDGGGGTARDRGHGGEGGNIPRNRLGIGQLEQRRAGTLSGPHAFAGTEHEQIAAEAGDLFGDLPGRTTAEGHQDDDGRHADDDA